MKLRLSVVSSPIDSPHEDGVGKSNLCQQFVYGRQVRVRKRWTENEWESLHINKNHFLYWGSIPLRLPDGTETIIRLVEQTTIWRSDGDAPYPSSSASFPKQAVQTILPSPGKSCCFPEQVSMYSHIDKKILKSDGRLVRDDDLLYPNSEFSDEGVSGFVCLIDPTLQGERMSHQHLFLKNFVQFAKQANRKVIFVISKCDLASEKQLIDVRNIVRNKLKKQAPIVEVSTVEMHNVKEAFVVIAQRCLRIKPVLQVLTWLQHRQAKMQLFSRQVGEFREYLLRMVGDSSWTWEEFWQQLKSSSQSFLAANIQQGELKRLFCLHILELKLKEAGGKFSLTPEEKTYRRLTSSQAAESAKSYQEYLFNSIKTHPDLTPIYTKGDYSHYASVDTHTDSKTSLSPIFTPPPLPPRAKESEDLNALLDSPVLNKGKTKLFGSKKLRKSMSWGTKSHVTVESPSHLKDIISQPFADYDVSLLNSMLSNSNTAHQLELPENKEDTFRRRAKSTSSGKYLHRPLPPSPRSSRIDKTTFPGMIPFFGSCKSPRHSRSRSDQLSMSLNPNPPVNQSFPDLSRTSIDMGEPTPYLDPMDLKMQTMPRFRHSQLVDSEADPFCNENSPKRIIKRENSFPFHDFRTRHSLDPLISPISIPKQKRDVSVQTYQRGQRRRESRWEQIGTPKLPHRKRETSTSCTCIQENTNEQDSGTASLICNSPFPSDSHINEQTSPNVTYDVLDPLPQES